MTGVPTSTNGASSMHLFWDLPRSTIPLVEASVDLIVPRMPAAERLMFWALQASFVDNGVTLGAGHLGLQYHPGYPGGGAVNWGGYHGAGSTSSGELAGSDLRLDSALRSPNTGTYPWQSGQTYRYRIYASPERGWRGSITDLQSGEETVIRDLWCPGTELGSLMVWTESFGHCDDPPVSVGWSTMVAKTSDGRTIQPRALQVNYQRVSDGGCRTTDTRAKSTQTGTMVWQLTGTSRETPQGTVLPLGS